MTEAILRQQQLMKQQTFGVEVEMANISRENAAKIGAGFFGTSCYYKGGTYDTWAFLDNLGREWKCMYDSSIRSDIREEKCELVTPILHYDDMSDLQEIVRKMRKAGAKSDYTLGCGVHVHVGADLCQPGGHNATTLRSLTNIMASHELLLSRSIEVADSRSNYCAPVNPSFVHDVNKWKPKTIDDLCNIWYRANGSRSDGYLYHYDHSRYHIMNLHATFTKGTIEFRMFQFDPPSADRKNGLHAGKLKSYIQLSLALSQRAKAVRGASNLIPEVQNENPKFAMRTWLDQLALVGDEFATCRSVFTERLPGNAAWRYGARGATSPTPELAEAVAMWINAGYRTTAV